MEIYGPTYIQMQMSLQIDIFSDNIISKKKKKNNTSIENVQRSNTPQDVTDGGMNPKSLTNTAI
jgi:hypothetical protein